MSGPSAPVLPANAPEIGRVASARRLLKRILGNSGTLLGGGLLLLIVLASLIGPLVYWQDPFTQDVANRIAEPFWNGGGAAHPFGTDTLGRDYLARLLYGGRISLLIGVLAVSMAAAIGVTLGLVAGYFGGRVDLVVRFLITTRLAMPVVLVALSVVATVGNSLTIVILVLGFLIWDRFAVVARTTAMQVRGIDYVKAARAVGSSHARIIFKEILPNISNGLIVVATVELANAILLEAALSFLGLGVQPPLPSWGLMIAEAKDYLFFSPWLITLPGIALVLLVLAINLLGDGVRDITAPSGTR
uniref:ABC transporter permease n=1 Tax=Bosea sp. NBC_00436 TaxID=2969620 RepID=A0A9E8A0T5_9HYPH